LSDEHQTPKSVSTRWTPPDELVQANVELLKEAHAELWHELKQIELVDGDLHNEAGYAFLAFIETNNPGLSVSNGAALTMSLRAAVRREIGRKV
jgi:hypothetical protein